MEFLNVQLVRFNVQPAIMNQTIVQLAKVIASEILAHALQARMTMEKHKLVFRVILNVELVIQPLIIVQVV
jgi:hypothetical protein